MTPSLSKSKLMAYRQCPRRLYLEVKHPERADVSEASASIMTTGAGVGELARSLHPDGHLIEANGDLASAIEQTERLLKAPHRQPLFEATVRHDGVLVRADLLIPDGKGWNLTEVKSSTSVKDHYYDDVAIQAFVLQGAGVALKNLAVQVINKEFVYPGNGRYHEVKRNGTFNSLFRQEHVGNEIATVTRKEVPRWIREARKVLTGPMPELTDHCHVPTECPFQGFCYADGPEYPVECLPRIRATQVKALRAQGYQDIRDIPDGVLKNPNHERVRQLTVSGKAELRPVAAEVLTKLAYPRYYLDFETIQFAVPIWTGTRPYQQLPFQWSCHRERKDGVIEHTEFLDLSGEDPTHAFAEQLIETLGNRGPILVYNQAFEGRIIRELATRYRDLAPDLQSLLPRLVDLMPIARDNYYHPQMKGSWSIKAVLPTIAPELDYADLQEVRDGGGAQQAYLDAISKETTAKRKAALRKALVRYCGRDTEALVALARFLARRGMARFPDAPEMSQPNRRHAI